MTGTSSHVHSAASKQSQSDVAVGRFEEQPKPPRSAFMCFADTKKRELMDAMGLEEVSAVLHKETLVHRVLANISIKGKR